MNKKHILYITTVLYTLCNTLYCHTLITVYNCEGGVVLDFTNFKSVIYELLLTQNTTHILNILKLPVELYKLYYKNPKNKYHTI